MFYNVMYQKSRLNSEIIWKIQKKSKFISEQTWKIWKKSRLNCEKDMENTEEKQVEQ